MTTPEQTLLYPTNDGSEHTHGGYCRFVHSWGSDEGIIESARMSTDKGFLGWEDTCVECGWAKGDDHEVGCSQPEKWKAGDHKLLERLWSHYHHTPFEMAGLAVEFKVPILVIRQVHRHRAASYNEFSARYSQMREEFWLPRPEHVRRQGGANKQGSIDDQSERWQQVQQDAVDIMASVYDRAYASYKLLTELGVANEQARAVLPVGIYTKCRMQANLRMWFHFLGLRQDHHAQQETRDLANAIAGFVEQCFPRSWALYQRYEVSKPVVRAPST